MPSPTTLPARVDSSILARYLTAGEPVVIVKLVSVGNTAPYDFRDAKGSRSYVFRWDLKAGGHVLRVPLSLWQANKAQIAHDIMDQRRLPNAIVVTVELPETMKLAEALPPAASTGSEEKFILDCINATLASYAGTKTTLESLQECLDRIANAVRGTVSTKKGATDTANEGDVQNVVGLSQASPPTVAPASEETITDNIAYPQDGSQHMLGDKPLHEVACDNVEQPKRIKALASILGVEEDILRAAIESPGSKVELVKAGWVRRKES